MLTLTGCAAGLDGVMLGLVAYSNAVHNIRTIVPQCRARRVRNSLATTWHRQHGVHKVSQRSQH